MDGASPLPDLEVVTASDGDRVTVTISGDVDIAAVPILTGRLDEAIATSGNDVVIDLGDVTFIDCAGLALLLATQRRLANDERRLVLASPARCVRRLLVLAGVDQLFDVHASGDRPQS